MLSLVASYAVGSAANLVATEKDGRFIRNAFAHYLAPALVERLASDPEQLTLGGEERELTLLFCDIRGFTSLSESMSPVELTQFLNDFLTPMTTALLNRQATIDKYMGDAIMAFWNAPLSQQDHQRLACQGVLDMQMELVELNKRAPHTLEIGIGLNTGQCCVGNLGSNQRFNYSAVGDAVNVASRVEGLTKNYGLDNLIVEETMMGLEGFAFLEIDLVSVVGRDQPLRIFTLLGGSDLAESERFQHLQKYQALLLEAYRAGEIASAVEYLNNVRAMNFRELDKFTELFSARLSQFLSEGVPKSWDGVFKATEK